MQSHACAGARPARSSWLLPARESMAPRPARQAPREPDAMQVNPEEKERRQEALDRELCVTVIIARIAIDWRRTHAPRPYVCSEKNPTNGRRPFLSSFC